MHVAADPKRNIAQRNSYLLATVHPLCDLEDTTLKGPPFEAVGPYIPSSNRQEDGQIGVPVRSFGRGNAYSSISVSRLAPGTP